MLKSIMLAGLAAVASTSPSWAADAKDVMVAVMSPDENGNTLELRHQPIEHTSCVKLFENLERARKEGLAVKLTFSNPAYSGTIHTLYCIRTDGSFYGDVPPRSD